MKKIIPLTVLATVLLACSAFAAKKKISSTKKKNLTVKKSKAQEKNLEKENISPIKEIKDKKSGWWQK